MIGPKPRLRIAVDLDGVLAESMEIWCELANAELGTHVKIEDLDGWSWWRRLPITKDDFYRLLDESWEEWQRIPPTEPRISAKIARIAEFGDVDIVTGRSKRTEKAAKNWIENQKIRYNQFVRVDGWKDKADLAYDVFIDDAPDLMPVISRRLVPWAILYERPWNRNVADMRKVLKAKSWTQIPKLLDQIQKSEGSGQ